MTTPRKPKVVKNYQGEYQKLNILYGKVQTKQNLFRGEVRIFSKTHPFS